MKRIAGLFSIFLYSICFQACTKFLDVGSPQDKVSANSVYSNDNSAAAVLTGIYYDLQNEISLAQGGGNISIYCSVLADESNVLANTPYYSYYTNNATPDYWGSFYRIVYRVNRAIEGISVSSSLSKAVSSQLLGECRFLRAFCYFYLVNFYGDVPLLLTSDFRENASARRVSKQLVYEQITEDLNLAKSLLNEKYLKSNVIDVSSDRVRPNKWAAVALLSRTYLYLNKWKECEQEATLIIDQKNTYDTVSLDRVFLKNSKEAIWQLEPHSEDGTTLNTLLARRYIFVNGQPDFEHPVWAGTGFLQSFEVGDKRKGNWLGVDSSNGARFHYYYKYKYRKPEDPSMEYVMVLRLSEQYLIRANARTNLGDFIGACSDLNIIRRRAGLNSIEISSVDDLNRAILQERRVELFTEWGDRWLELKRIGMINSVMSLACAIKGGVWQSYKQYFALPIEDLKYNRHLVQNDGYPSF